MYSNVNSEMPLILQSFNEFIKSKKMVRIKLITWPTLYHNKRLIVNNLMEFYRKYLQDFVP